MFLAEASLFSLPAGKSFAYPRSALPFRPVFSGCWCVVIISEGPDLIRLLLHRLLYPAGHPKRTASAGLHNSGLCLSCAHRCRQSDGRRQSEWQAGGSRPHSGQCRGGGDSDLRWSANWSFSLKAFCKSSSLACAAMKYLGTLNQGLLELCHSVRKQ